MDKRAKSKGGEPHRNAHGRGTFPKSSNFSGRFSPHHDDEPPDKIPDLKSKRPIPMRRPKTHPELLNRTKPALEQTPWLNLETHSFFAKKVPPVESANNKSSAKLLVNVTVAQSIGPLRVLVSNDATVLDAINGVLAQYVKEGRRPFLSSDPLSFGLHFSQFSIECLDPKETIKELGCRNFFLWPKKESGESVVRCGTEMEKEAWRCYKFLMEWFLLWPLRFWGKSIQI